MTDSCLSSSNIICKHTLDEITYYVDASWLPAGVNIVSVEAESEDETLVIDTVEPLEEDTDVTQSEGCVISLVAGRAVLIRLTDGTASDEETLVTLVMTCSDGDVRTRILRLSIE